MMKTAKKAFPSYGNLVLVTCILVLVLAEPAHPATITDQGADGANGAPGMNGGDGGDGQRGADGLASLSLVNTTESFVEAIGIGGNGGHGGDGGISGNGGNGGAGGTGIGNVNIEPISGPANAFATGIGGNGGSFGTALPGLLSGSGNRGGNGNAAGSAIVVDGSPVHVSVTSIGGNGGITSGGVGPASNSGGIGLILDASGESNDGPVTIDVFSQSGNGGPGAPNSDGMTIGNGGQSRSVSLFNVANAVTSGPITINQTAKAGAGGSGLFPGITGGATSRLEMTEASQSLLLNAVAEGGIGGGSQFGNQPGNGGGAVSHADATNTIGISLAFSRATGGIGGAILQQQPPFGGSILANSGGDATAYAEADGLNPQAVATASGGAASSQSAFSGQINVFGGSGGDAVADAIARTIGNQSFSADARAHGGVRTNVLSLNPGASLAGARGTAIATARGTGDFGSTLATADGRTAIAQSISVAGGGTALARATAARINAASLRVERAEVDTSVGSVLGVANLISAAGGGQPPVASNPNAQITAIGLGRGAGRLYGSSQKKRNIAIGLSF